MLTHRVRRPLPIVLTAAALGVLLTAAPFAAAQTGTGTRPRTTAGSAQPTASDPAELLEEFRYYTAIARPDMANAFAEQLLSGGWSDAELAEALDDMSADDIKKFDDAMQKALRTAESADLAGQLTVRIETGRLDLARDPQRINQAVGMLTGSVREQRLAETRLQAAGEYAVPALLRQLTEAQQDMPRQIAARMLVKLGRIAVAPLCAALPYLHETNQREVCVILGDIGYAHSAPYLLEVAQNSSNPQPVRDAARLAYQRVGGSARDLSREYSSLSEQYFSENLSLIPYPNDPRNNIWAYDAMTGLAATPVPTPIYSEVMGMRTSSKALTIDASNKDAISLFVASNLRRENELPDGADDPVYGQLPYTPMFYATVFGTDTSLDVLRRALGTVDTPLVRDSIDALARITGGANLLGFSASSRPLVEAMHYPDRRVQYESALVLGGALPRETYQGDQLVVPILSSAVRTGNRNFALVLADNEEDRRVLATQLQDMDFEIVGSGARAEEVQFVINDAVGIDLVVIRKSVPQSAIDTVAALRGNAKVMAAPMLVFASATDEGRLRQALREESAARVERVVSDQQAFADTVDQVMQSAAGGRITEIESEEYAIRALGVLRDVAIAGASVYDLRQAESALVDALDTRSGGTRLLTADILALIDSDRAQRQLFDAALNASGDEQVDLLSRVAESIKRIGDRAEPRHVSALLDLVENTTGATAEAAAEVHGALNLPASNAIGLIPE